jgi:anti-sigma factor RsiW
MTPPRPIAATRPSPKCRALLVEISEYLDGELPPSRRRIVERHMESCTCCGTMASRLRRVVEACRADRKRPPRTVMNRAMSRVRRLLAAADRKPTR